MTALEKVSEPENLLPADPYISMIERVALDPDADLDKLERMLEMKERLEAKTARDAYASAMAASQAEMEPVSRNKRNDQTKSNYSDLAEIYKSCKPISTAHGLTFSTYPIRSDKEGYLSFRWVVRHTGGHIEEGEADIPVDDRGTKGTVNKTGVHAFGSTASYARRYLFCMIFDIATTDDNDGNAPSGDPITEEQYGELQDLIQEADITEDIVCTAERVSILPELPATMFAKVKRELEITIKKKSEAA